MGGAPSRGSKKNGWQVGDTPLGELDYTNLIHQHPTVPLELVANILARSGADHHTLLLICKGLFQSLHRYFTWCDVAVIKDANGNVLQDGDAVTVIKDLKVKGSSLVVKVGTKVKSIRLLPDASDGHDIDCKIDGIGAMKLKSEFVKKA